MPRGNGHEAARGTWQAARGTWQVARGPWQVARRIRSLQIPPWQSVLDIVADIWETLFTSYLPPNHPHLTI